jgi:hypothetical protein
MKREVLIPIVMVVLFGVWSLLSFEKLHTARAAPPSEYKVAAIEQHLLEKRLNTLAKEGWELVSVGPPTTTHERLSDLPNARTTPVTRVLCVLKK